jgi:ATP adenylyltransferase
VSSPAPRATARGSSKRIECEAEAPTLLWAPWRLEYILSAKTPGCIFCDYPAETGPENDRKNLIVHRSPRSFTILNRYPYNSGHVMVIPLHHVDTLEALSSEEFADLHEELRLAARIVREVYRPEGLNLGMNLGRIAGAGIDEHLHYHVVPRWGGDTNFMPVLADTRVMVEHLDGAWQKLRAGFEKHRESA